MLDGLENLDLTAMIASLNPGEAQPCSAMRRCSSTMPRRRSTRRRSRSTSSKRNTTSRATGAPSRHAVSIDVLVVEGSVRRHGVRVGVLSTAASRAAATVRSSTPATSSSSSGDESEPIDDMLSEGPGATISSTCSTEAFADYDQPGVTVMEIDGAWFVSPIATYFDQLLAVSAGARPGELERSSKLCRRRSMRSSRTSSARTSTSTNRVLDDHFSDDRIRRDTIPTDDASRSTPFPDDPIEHGHGAVSTTVRRGDRSIGAT